jgi:hypothetical protein
MKILERDPFKRVDDKGLIRYHDSLEVVNYGDTVSLQDFWKIYEESLRGSDF